MILLFVSTAVVVIGTWYFRRRKRSNVNIELTKHVPDWSPINILWFENLPDMSVVLDEHDYTFKYNKYKNLDLREL